MMNFIVGKHYKYKDSGPDGLDFECVYVTPKGNGVFRTSSGNEAFIYKTNTFFVEVKTFRKIKKYIGVFCSTKQPEKVLLSSAYDSESGCRDVLVSNGWVVLDIITIDWVEKT